MRVEVTVARFVKTTIDGKLIGNSASADFTRAEIDEHLAWARCQAEELFGRGYATATADLHNFTARGSQAGQPLDSYFGCVGGAELPAMDYGIAAKDSASVNCQKTVGAQVRGYARKRHLLVRNCLDALLAHQAAQTAGATANQIAALFDELRHALQRRARCTSMRRTGAT